MQESSLENMRNRVKCRRQSLKVKQQELADVLGISRQTLSSIERERYNLTLSLAYKITMALGVSSIEELFSFEDEEEELPDSFDWDDKIGK